MRGGFAGNLKQNEFVLSLMPFSWTTVLMDVNIGTIFRGCAKRLAELESVSSESTGVDVFVNQTTNPDRDHVVETLKGMESLTLLKYYFQITNKAVDLEKPQLGGIKHRTLKMNVGMSIDEGDIINLSGYAQKDG